MRPLEGRVALVTGSTSGIGLGVADAFAREGVDIMLNGFGDAELVARVKDQVQGHGVRVGYSSADMSKPKQIAALVSDTAKQLGSLDILVNNAGIQYVAPIEEFPPDKWDAVIAINLSSSFHAIRHALPLMKRKGWGRIINIASVHGLVASAQKAAYVAAKHGLVGLTKVVALETATTGVTCNAICPGWVLTPLVQQQIDARVAGRDMSAAQAKAGLLTEKQPSMEFVTPEQIGALAVFLCSEAASQIRGASYAVDGGWTAQ
ncbi:MAG TPA: 3-hydroxybutyrate dehydrogenase [Burkholderiales bacterium]|nr:3-hydroxybutyrate dehydrogenase [Burkholderiales bacterium]